MQSMTIDRAMTAIALSEEAEYRLHLDRKPAYPALHRQYEAVGAYGFREWLLTVAAPIADEAYSRMNPSDWSRPHRSETEDLELWAFDFEFCPLALTILTEGRRSHGWQLDTLAPDIVRYLILLTVPLNAPLRALGAIARD